MRERAGSSPPPRSPYPAIFPPAWPDSARLPVSAWETRYRIAVICIDLAVILGTLVVVHAVTGNLTALQQSLLTAVSFTVVVLGVSGSRAWSAATLGDGAEELRTLYRGLVNALVVLALGGFALGLDSLRSGVFLAVPAIALVSFPIRYLHRQLLHKRRRSGHCMLPVLAAGAPPAVADLIDRTRQAPHHGWRIEAVCTADGIGQQTGSAVEGVPVVGRIENIAEHVRRGGYRIVAVTADTYWTPQRLQRLAWELENTSADLVAAPMLMEVTGPRLHVTSVLGLPLLRLSAPVFTGTRRLIKEIVDRVGAVILLALLCPLLTVIALCVKMHDGGCVFYRQRRIGKNGAPFTIIKFRTMCPDADARRSGLLALNDAGGPLFKIRKDPRVTKLGAVLRRFSMDELPQLFNVLAGHMSLVGPRPPLPEETERYNSTARRRLLVKPGLTGLWQVSGRSDLSWEEAIRLDLRYVEDWSLALDALILWKTIRAVLKGRGAY